jgi:hypothetical protein
VTLGRPLDDDGFVGTEGRGGEVLEAGGKSNSPDCARRIGSILRSQKIWSVAVQSKGTANWVQVLRLKRTDEEQAGKLSSR